MIEDTSLMFEFPLKDVDVERVNEIPFIQAPSYEGASVKVSQNEFLGVSEGTGTFFVRDGGHVEYYIEPGADPEWVRLYLNNQVVVALLHQRKIINFHASSFIHDGLGVMVLGETGAGKSSVTLAFAISGAGFMTDDLTPLVLTDGKPHIQPLHREIKLRLDTIRQLGLEEERLRDAENGTGKKYLAMTPALSGDHLLDCIFMMEVGDVPEPLFVEPSPSEKFALLRGEICMAEILAGMPETEADYLRQLVGIVEQIPVVRVIRPPWIRIAGLHNAVKEELHRLKNRG